MMRETDPERSLTGAVIRRAIRDAQSRNGRAASARRWLLESDDAAMWLSALGIDREGVVEWVQSLEPPRQPALF
jgi:hypothetical protein